MRPPTDRSLAARWQRQLGREERYRATGYLDSARASGRPRSVGCRGWESTPGSATSQPENDWPTAPTGTGPLRLASCTLDSSDRRIAAQLVDVIERSADGLGPCPEVVADLLKPVGHQSSSGGRLRSGCGSLFP